MTDKRLQVALSEEEWQMLGEIRARMGFRTDSATVRYLIRREKNETG